MVIVFGVITFPFLVDFLYGKGVLAFYPNAFSADTWFSFVASYFPSTIIGILTIYQAHIIQEKDKQYQELLDKYRFVPYRHANFYRHNKEKCCIGPCGYEELCNMRDKTNSKIKLAEWEKGYVFQCYLKDSRGIKIDNIDFRCIEWKIKDNMFVQNSVQNTVIDFRNEFNGEYCITGFCYFEETKKFYQEMAQCMNNSIRKNSDYNFSEITLKLHMTYDEKKEKNLDMHFMMQSQTDTCKLCSIKEYYVGY